MSKEVNKKIDTIKKMSDILEKEKKIYNSGYFLTTGKIPHANFNVRLLPPTIRASEYVELFMALILNLDEVNEKLNQTYKLWDKIILPENVEVEFFNSYYINKLRVNSIIIIHLIKHFIDMMIIILVKECCSKNKRKVDSIGSYFHYKPKELGCLRKHDEFLKTINIIENANKHKLNSVYSFEIIGKNELCFLAIDENGEVISVTARDVVNGFNCFFKDIVKVLDSILSG